MRNSMNGNKSVFFLMPTRLNESLVNWQSAVFDKQQLCLRDQTGFFRIKTARATKGMGVQMKGDGREAEAAGKGRFRKVEAFQERRAKKVGKGRPAQQKRGCYREREGENIAASNGKAGFGRERHRRRRGTKCFPSPSENATGCSSLS